MEIVLFGTKHYIVKRKKNGEILLTPVIESEDDRTPLSKYSLDELFDEIINRKEQR